MKSIVILLLATCSALPDVATGPSLNGYDFTEKCAAAKSSEYLNIVLVNFDTSVGKRAYSACNEDKCLMNVGALDPCQGVRFLVNFKAVDDYIVDIGNVLNLVLSQGDKLPYHGLNFEVGDSPNYVADFLENLPDFLRVLTLDYTSFVTHKDALLTGFTKGKLIAVFVKLNDFKDIDLSLLKGNPKIHVLVNEKSKGLFAGQPNEYSLIEAEVSNISGHFSHDVMVC